MDWDQLRWSPAFSLNPVRRNRGKITQDWGHRSLHPLNAGGSREGPHYEPRAA